eukprot:Blabericola_migrator_1__6417@NODE_3236_length_1927_cov_3_319355_g2027_i0_p3_GENE_NODE_3236_length_1927_cov_3_319355_g2027_i0NODE_3236_length_1927_cov_3_319355_g2027_i0_p3_ORF_typecomplete_len108_score7_27_NODE_3236_length_1927_cov_3_319355_g2027_i012011524
MRGLGYGGAAMAWCTQALSGISTSASSRLRASTCAIERTPLFLGRHQPLQPLVVGYDLDPAPFDAHIRCLSASTIARHSAQRLSVSTLGRPEPRRGQQRWPSLWHQW